MSLIPRTEDAQVAEIFQKFNLGGVDPGCLAQGDPDPTTRAPGSQTLGYWRERVSGPAEEVRFLDANRQRPGA